MASYPGQPGADLGAAIVAFGWQWLYIAVPAAVLVAVLVWLARRGDRVLAGRGYRGFGYRMAHGAADLTGLPAWCAGPLAVLLGAFGFAARGFFWDVAWHIDIGRDEFLFSPPHVALLAGLGLLGVAGLLAVGVATRDGAAVGWRVDRWRVPYGAAGLVVAGAASVTAFGVDELWHWAYGLDVTMWSPPHLTMISMAALGTLSQWLLVAEARPGDARWLVRWAAPAFAAVVVVVGASAWQLEFDLGVPQWPQGYQPVLMALAAGFGLTAARAALGPGGALVAAGGFVAVRVTLLVQTAGVLDLTMPRLPAYLGAALGVEAAFRLTRGRRLLARAVAAGVAVGTLGLAAEWAWTHVAATHPWQPGLAPMVALAALTAVAAAVLGAAFGRIVGGASVRAGARHTGGIPAPAVAAGLVVIVAALAAPLPRTVPDAVAEVRTTPAGEGLVAVEVELTPADAALGADRFEVMAWQGGGRVLAPLEPVAPGRYATTTPVPAGGDWKTLVRLARGSALGSVAVYQPADAEIGASEVPLVAERTAPLVADEHLLLREAQDGPLWPGVLGYAFAGASIAALIVLAIAGAIGLERRRRADDEPPVARSTAATPTSASR